MIDVNGPQAQYDAEERCLKIARTAAKYEYTKNVIQEIIGDNIVEPTRSNTPLDFIIKDENTGKPIGGIEHFYIGLIYENNSENKVSLKSVTKKHIETLKTIYNSYEAVENPIELHNASNELNKMLCGAINDMKRFKYKQYIKQFNYQAQNHFRKIQNYCKTANCNPDNIVFLIEIETPNSCKWNVMTVAPQKISELPHSNFPITQDIIDILKSGRKYGIRNIILVIHDTFGSKSDMVYAFDVQNIEESCQRQQIVLYECFAPKPLIGTLMCAEY